MTMTTVLVGLILCGALGLAVWAVLRLRLRPASPPTRNRSAVPPAISSRHIQASLALSAALLEAHDEESTLRAALRAGCDALDADGCLFMPFDEFSQRLSPLEFGRTPATDAKDWREHLTKPSQRQACKVCAARHAGQDCALLKMGLTGGYVHCVPLVSGGREVGLFSFIFSAEPHVDKSAEWYLTESMRLVDLALEAREREAFLRPSLAGLSQLPALAGEMQSLLPQIEFRAVVGERARLAREIHDGLAQTLAFLKIEIGRAERSIQEGRTDQAAQILKASSRTLGDAYLDARQAIENLRRVPDGRLEDWLQRVAEDFGSLTGLPVELDLRLSRDFAPNQKIQLIRIAQEALTNVRRHAGASRVRIAAWEDGEEAVVEVQDNGRGFSPTDLTATRFGLRGMRERAESIGAEFQVASRPNEGTTVRLQIPLREGVKP